jgi:hypothetical protein
MIDEKTLVICNTAFQIFCASSYINNNNLKNCHLIITNHKKPPRISQALLNMVNWGEIFECYEDLSGFKGLFAGLIRFLKKVSNFNLTVDSVIIGSITNSHIPLILNHVTCDRLYAVDDGMETLSYLDGLKKIRYGTLFKRAFINCFFLVFFKKRIYQITDLYRRLDGLITIFSQVTQKSPKKIIANKLIIPKNVGVEKKCFFLAQPLFQQGLIKLSKSEYFSKLNDIRNFYEKQGIRFFYLPHPREEVLKEIADKFKIIRPESVVELFFVIHQKIPSHIASFFSTSLITTKSMLAQDRRNINIESWRLKDNLWHESRRIYILDIYEKLSDFGIPVHMVENKSCR